jgi:hypothetical protein
MTEAQGTQLLEALARLEWYGNVIALAMGFMVGMKLWGAWFYAKNQRDVYLVPLALCLCGASTASAQSTLFDDQFDGPDGQYLTLHTPNVDVSGLGWMQSSGTFTLQGNLLNTASSPASWRFQAAADGVYTLTAGNTTGVGDTLLVARINNANATSVHALWRSSGEVRIREGSTTISGVGNVPYTAGATLTFKLEGSTLRILNGSTVVVSATSTLNQTSGLCGLNSNNAGRTFARVKFTTIGAVAGGFANPALIHNDGGGRSWVIESVGTQPSYFGSGYDNEWDPTTVVDVVEVSTGVSASNAAGQIYYSASAGNTPYFIRAAITYNGKTYYGQAKTTISTSGLVQPTTASGTHWNNWKAAIDKWEAAHPAQEGYFTWTYQGTQIPLSAAQTFTNNPGVRISAPSGTYDTSEGVGSLVTLVKYNEESEEDATVWLKNDAGQWHKWTLSADGVIADAEFRTYSDWQTGTPPVNDAPGFGDLSGAPGEPGEPTDPPEEQEDLIEEAVTPPLACNLMTRVPQGTFHVTKSPAWTADYVESTSDNWASDIRRINGGDIVTFCGVRWWKIGINGGSLVLRVANHERPSPKWYDWHITAPKQPLLTTTWGGIWNSGAHAYYPITDGYSRALIYGDPTQTGPGTWDYDSDTVPNVFDKGQRECGWTPKIKETWDHDCDEVPNHWDPDFPPPFVAPPTDTDGDGTPDDEDDDIDGDGKPNDEDDTPIGEEEDDDGPYNDGCNCTPASKGYPKCDQDDDGLCDAIDWDDDGDGIRDSLDPDSAGDLDGDGIADNLDDDDDGDGIKDWLDGDQDGDGEVDDGGDEDSDGDGIPNEDDDDIDGDGVANNVDADLDGDGIANLRDNDVDGDGRLNPVDPDDDGDGLIDTWHPAEGNGAGKTEAPTTPEEGEAYWKDPDLPDAPDGDTDEDGTINDEDDDIDGDGTLNNEDPDANGDGVRDQTETGSDCRSVGYKVPWSPTIGQGGLGTPEYPDSQVLSEQEAGYLCTEGETLSKGNILHWFCCKGEDQEGEDCGCECFKKLFKEMDDSLGKMADTSVPDYNDDEATFDVGALDFSSLTPPQVPLDGAPGIELSIDMGELGAMAGVPTMTLPIATEQGYGVHPVVQAAYMYLREFGMALLCVCFILTMGIWVGTKLWSLVD